ncbi:glycosyl transferase family 2 [Photobacterium proteolyticum]|uniref:Glycosyl transferase family 2 n=1 Tax=Photobacterium proteolyticum TaxID=1903952 RepID=A0A1Q9GNE6_9GAMM|nr:glycosyltransferase family 2 protein [Photobacterium proteolyticum]OLQ76116.1 glycosyl transferase family 2 [Photobacterium proteolyticum]
MAVYISVVSHGHGGLIKQLDCLANLAEKFNVVVKLNLKELDLVSYLKENNIHVIDELYGLGFGHNNNVVFSHCSNILKMNDGDTFIVFNPDVISSVEAIEQLVDSMNKEKVPIAAVNLFKDAKYSLPDNSIRKFPSLTQFINSFLGLGNSSIINKKNIIKPTITDWAAGSFLAFTASHYKTLQGFDENYFMYCEDIDICFRSNRLGSPVTFFPNVKMQHLAEHANRSMFSKHFYWHLKSVIRFLLCKRGLTKVKSSL